MQFLDFITTQLTKQDQEAGFQSKLLGVGLDFFWMSLSKIRHSMKSGYRSSCFHLYMMAWIGLTFVVSKILDPEYSTMYLLFLTCD